MSNSNYATNPNFTQPRANIEHAQSQHWDELSQVALYLYYLVSNQMKPPPALPAGCFWDEFVGKCLLSHLRAEFHDTEWPEKWDALKDRDIPEEMVAKLHFVARRRTFKGVCEICAEWTQDDPPETTAIETQEAVKQFLASRRNMPEGSLTSYRHTLTAFAKHCPMMPTTPEELDSYFARFNHHRGGASAYSPIRQLYQFASDRLGLPNVMKLVKRPGFKETEKPSFTLDEFRSILEACRDDRERVLVHLEGGHGFRPNEAIGVSADDIGDQTIFVAAGKKRQEFMPLLPETRELLLRLAGDNKASDAVFVSQFRRRLSDRMAYNIVKGILLRAGIKGKGYSPYSLRHSFSTLSQEHGLDFAVCQRLMRHRKQTMTEHYTHFSRDYLRCQLEAHSPLRQINLDKGKLPTTEY